jgi:predicted  nucleic acid-binding Zn-ribbon protein
MAYLSPSRGSTVKLDAGLHQVETSIVHGKSAARELQDAKLSLTSAELDNAALKGVIDKLQREIRTLEDANRELRLRVVQAESTHSYDVDELVRKYDSRVFEADNRASNLEEAMSSLVQTNAALQQQLTESTARLAAANSRSAELASAQQETLQSWHASAASASFASALTHEELVRRLTSAETQTHASRVAEVSLQREVEALRSVLSQRNDEIATLRVSLARVSYDLSTAAVPSREPSTAAAPVLSATNPYLATLSSRFRRSSLQAASVDFNDSSQHATSARRSSITSSDASPHAIAARVAAAHAAVSASAAQRAATLSPARAARIPLVRSSIMQHPASPPQAPAASGRRDKPMKTVGPAKIPQDTRNVTFPATIRIHARSPSPAKSFKPTLPGPTSPGMYFPEASERSLSRLASPTKPAPIHTAGSSRLLPQRNSSPATVHAQATSDVNKWRGILDDIDRISSLQQSLASKYM